MYNDLNKAFGMLNEMWDIEEQNSSSGFLIKTIDVGGDFGQDYYLSEKGYNDIVTGANKINDDFIFWTKQPRKAHSFKSKAEAEEFVNKYFKQFFGSDELDNIPLIGEISDNSEAWYEIVAANDLTKSTVSKTIKEEFEDEDNDYEEVDS